MKIRDICSAALLKIAKRWKQSKWSLPDKWIKKMCCIHIMEYYSTKKKKEILSNAAARMNLETLY